MIRYILLYFYHVFVLITYIMYDTYYVYFIRDNILKYTNSQTFGEKLVFVTEQTRHQWRQLFLSLSLSLSLSFRRLKLGYQENFSDGWPLRTRTHNVQRRLLLPRFITKSLRIICRAFRSSAVLWWPPKSVSLIVRLHARPYDRPSPVPVTITLARPLAQQFCRPVGFWQLFDDRRVPGRFPSTSMPLVTRPNIVRATCHG
jgi:hypothetical protein